MPKTSETTNETARDIIDRAFRPGSSAQKVAALLFDGDPHSRDSLASDVGVSPSTVPRVVNKLRSEGVTVAETVGRDGRSKVLQVTDAARAEIESLSAGSTISSLLFAGNVVEVVAHGRKYVFTFRADGAVTMMTPRQEITIT